MATKANPDVQIMQALNELGSTVNVLEDRYVTLRKKVKVSDENLLQAERALAKDMRVINDELLELKSKITKLSQQLGEAFQDAQNLVQRHEFLELKKYVDFWAPMNFITRKEAEELTQSLKETNTEDEQDGTI